MRTIINSIAIYGSKARLDFDQHSDNDLLVVADSFENLYDVERAFSRQGYSCSAYTFKRLQNLVDKKALFIQHLKQDAKMLFDKDDRLSILLKNFSPKDSYDVELKEAKDYFKLLNYIPDTKLGIGWAFDIIAIGIRNYNILELANHKIYEFSLNKILENSKRIFNLTDSEIEILLNSRIAKKHYREKSFDLLPSKTDLLESIKVIEKRYSISINPVFLDNWTFNQYSFEAIYSNKLTSGYQRLRLFEAFIMTHTKDLNSDLFKKCRRIIENPKFYVFNFNDQKYVDKLLTDIFN
jgi:hypothetical protein